MSGVIFFIDGVPRPKGRPRVVRGHTFTPKLTREWESLVGWEGKLAIGSQGPLQGPLGVELTFYGARKNADLDNLCKAVLDGLNKICYDDDRQISMMTVAREELFDHRPGVLVKITPLPSMAR